MMVECLWAVLSSPFIVFLIVLAAVVIYIAEKERSNG